MLRSLLKLRGVLKLWGQKIYNDYILMLSDYADVTRQRPAEGWPWASINNNYFQDESKMSLSLEQDNIIWPGGLRKKPTGLMIPTHLNVLTISEQPFVYNRTLAPGEICDRDGEILCPQYNTEASNPTVSCKPISR